MLQRYNETHVLYSDGHVELLTRAELEKRGVLPTSRQAVP